MVYVCYSEISKNQYGLNKRIRGESMTYTQGPWRVTGKSIRSDNHIDGEGALLLNAGPMFYEYTPDPEEQNANLQLAASAPDLLLCLQKWMSFQINSGLEGCDEIVEQTEKAIAKATGAEVEA